MTMRDDDPGRSRGDVQRFRHRIGQNRIIIVAAHRQNGAMGIEKSFARCGAEVTGVYRVVSTVHLPGQFDWQ